MPSSKPPSLTYQRRPLTPGQALTALALWPAITIAAPTSTAEADPAKAAEEDTALFSETIATQLDWQPLSVIPADQQNLRCRQCVGKFIDPLAGQPPTEPRSTDVEVSADTSNATEGNLVFSGDVRVQQGNRGLRAETVTFDLEQQIT